MVSMHCINKTMNVRLVWQFSSDVHYLVFTVCVVVPRSVLECRSSTMSSSLWNMQIFKLVAGLCKGIQSPDCKEKCMKITPVVALFSGLFCKRRSRITTLFRVIVAKILVQ